MRVLIVEDDDNKREQLLRFLRAHFDRAEPWTERSLQSGLRRIRRELPDIVLLDMTLPNYDASADEPGGATHAFGGRQFLQQMDRFDIDVPVVVVTQFETFGQGTTAMDLAELDRSLREEHGNIYRGSVYYHASIHGWEETLLRQMRQALHR